MSDILHFFWIAFRQYWSTWVTGTGLVGFGLWLLNQYDKRRVERGRRPMTMRQNLLILFCTFWFLATFSAWHDTDKNLAAVKKQREKDTGDLAICQGDLKAERTRSTSLDTLNRTIESTIGTQQTTLTGQQQNLNSQQGTMNSQQVAMNACVVALGKANTPEPLKTVIGFVNAEFQGLPVTKHRMLMLAYTNKIMPSPARGLMFCDKPFKYASLAMPGGSLVSGGDSVIDNHIYQFDLISPQWTPINPLVFVISFDGEDLGNCGIKTQ